MLHLLDRAVEALLGAILAALVAINGAQVVWRYALGNPLTWSLEASIVLLVWGTMLSGYIGVRRNTHLSADFLGIAWGGRTQRYRDIACLALSLVFTAAYGWFSIEVIDAMAGIGFTSIPIGQPALYAALPVSAVLIAIALLQRLRESIAAPAPQPR